MDSVIDDLKVFRGYMQDDYGLSWVPPWLAVATFLSICSLYSGVVVIAVMGMFHPAVVTMYVRRDKSEKYMAKLGGILSFSYCAVCLLLLIGILIDSEWILVFYEYFTALFIGTCILVMIYSALWLCVHCECKVSMLACAMMPLIIFSFLAYGVVVVNSYRHTVIRDGNI